MITFARRACTGAALFISTRTSCREGDRDAEWRPRQGRARLLRYLFGRPVRAARPRADGERELFVLGAYPSALHVRWHVPGLQHPVQAVAVDDEPEPFWAGRDEAAQIDRWSGDVGFRAQWGRVSPCGHLNGSSGLWVEDMILRPLRIPRERAWITDCLDTYFTSTGAAARLSEPAIVGALARLGIPPPEHRPHPSENDIVREALAGHRDRLVADLTAAKSRLVVTLGNAALRVMAALAGGGALPRKLSYAPALYAKPIGATIAQHSFEWLPLAHPAAPAPYQRAHEAWCLALSPAPNRE
jgi:hypothetical protein